LVLVACSLLAGAVALVAADFGLGFALGTRQRHLLRLAPNQAMRHRASEFDYVLHTNSLGLRGPDVAFDKPPGARRVVVIGDSFVAGYGVPDDEVLTVQLERLLNPPASPDRNRERVEVVNVGRTGSSTIRELDLYESIGRRFQPDVVVLAYFLGNDLSEVMIEHDAAELARWHPDGLIRRTAYALCPNLYLELAIFRRARETAARAEPRPRDLLVAIASAEAERRGIDARTAIERYDHLPPAVRADLEEGLLSDQRILPACYEPDRFRRSFGEDEPFFQAAWPRTERHLELLRQAVARDGGRLVLMIIPDGCQVDEACFAFDASLGFEVDPDWRTSDCPTLRALQGWAADHTVPFLDLTGPFRQSEGGLYYPQDGHFNGRGHLRTAECLASFLDGQELLGERRQ
jgi:hypothetical protein